LLFQDLAAIPLLVVVPILAQSGDTDIGTALGLAGLKGLGAAAVIFAVGRYALRPLLHEAGASRELFTLTALLLSLAAAWATQWIGLSLALGAFLAGMMLAETQYRHQIEDEVRPFRDVLLGLFFIVIGMQLQPALLPGAWAWIALLVAGIVLGKAAIVTLLARVYRYRLDVAVRTGLALAQGGEFSVALLALALGTALFSVEASQPMLAAIIVSMLMAPVLIRRGGSIAALVSSSSAEEHDDASDMASALGEKRDHVVVCGYGRVGRQLARILQEHGVEYVAVDNDPDRVKRGADAGESVYYGDATRRGVLEAAGLKAARAVVLSFDHLESSIKVLQETHDANPRVPVFARAADQAGLDALFDAGATEVVPETMETSLMLATQLLLLLGTPAERVLERMHAIRVERYRLLRPSENDRADK
jgi:monovalent cation:H+ antiporter-2, CPA2 family